MKFNLSGFLEGVAAVQAGAMAGRAQGLQARQDWERQQQAAELQRRQAALQQQEFDWRRAQAEQDDAYRNQVLQTNRDEAALKLLQPGTPEYLRLASRLTGIPAPTMPPAAPIGPLLQGMFGGPGQPEPGMPSLNDQALPSGMPAVPMPVRPAAAPAPAASPFRDPRAEQSLDSAYTSAISKWEALHTRETDPAQRERAARAIQALRQGQLQRLPIDRVTVDGQPLGAAGIAALPVVSVDPAQQKRVAADVGAQVKALQSLAKELPEDDPLRGTLATLATTAPTPGDYQSEDGLVTAENWVTRALAATVSAQGRLGRKDALSEAKLYSAELKNNIQGLAGASGPVLVAMLPELLDEETELAGKYKSAVLFPPRLHAERANIQRIRDLAASEDPNAQVQAENLAEEVTARITAGLSPGKEQAAFRNAMQVIGTWSTAEVYDPDKVREVFESLDIPHLIPAGGVGLGGRRAEQHFAKLLGELPAMAKLNPAGQATFLAELSGAAAAAGKKIPIPAQIVLQMSPETRERLALQRDRINLVGSRLDLAIANHDLSRSRFLYQLRKQQAGGGPDPVAAKQAANLKRDADRAFSIWKQFVERPENKKLMPDYAPGVGPPPAPGAMPILGGIFGGKGKPAADPKGERWKRANELYQAYRAAEQKFQNAAAPKPAPVDTSDLEPGPAPQRQSTNGRVTVKPKSGGSNRDRYITALRASGQLTEAQIQNLANQRYPPKR